MLNKNTSLKLFLGMYFYLTKYGVYIWATIGRQFAKIGLRP